MTGAHVAYFGQSQSHTLPEGDGKPGSSGNGRTQIESDFIITPVRLTLQWTEEGLEQRENRPNPDFRWDLIARIKVLVQDFRDQKMAKLETLFKILQVIQEADVDEHIRQATHKEYSTQVDLIDSQRRSAEQRGEHAAQLARVGEEPEVSGDWDDTERCHRRRESTRDRSNTDEAEKFMRDLRKELTRKHRQQSPTDPSGSDDELASGKREGESNKKRHIYQSDLPWYTVETDTQNHKIDENRKKTRETLRVFQWDITFAEWDIWCSATAPQGFPEPEWWHIFHGEAVNLDIVFSNLHHVAPPKENVGCIGRTEVFLGSSDPVRKVQTSGDWTAAWNATVKATAYAFPHQADELRQWGDYLSSEFSARQSSAHHKLIAFDKAVRTQVGGGQAILLTDRNEFSYLYSVFLLPDSI